MKPRDEGELIHDSSSIFVTVVIVPLPCASHAASASYWHANGLRLVVRALSLSGQVSCRPRPEGPSENRAPKVERSRHVRHGQPLFVGQLRVRLENLFRRNSSVRSPGPYYCGRYVAHSVVVTRRRFVRPGNWPMHNTRSNYGEVR